MKFSAKNGCDFRPKEGAYSTTTLVELSPDANLGRVPSNVVFLIDGSSSMGGKKWKTVKQAMTEMVGSLNEDDRVAVVLFDTNANVVFPLASLSKNRKTMQEAIEKLPDPQGVTNLEAGLKAAYQVFEDRSKNDKMKRVNHVILLTDGFPTDDQGYRVDETTKYETLVRNTESVTLTGVGIGSADDYDATFIGRISDLGRGSYYHANDLAKFKENMKAEIAKLQSSVVGELVLKFSNVRGKIMRIAKIAPEIVLYDAPGNGEFELKTGSMTRDLTAFLVQTNTTGDGAAGNDLKLFSVQAQYDDKSTEAIEVQVKTTDKESDLTQVDPDVMRGTQALQVHLNGEKIRLSLNSGDKAKATQLIQNTTRIASSLGQANVTRALGNLQKGIEKGDSNSDELATIQDESKKTRLLIR